MRVERVRFQKCAIGEGPMGADSRGHPWKERHAAYLKESPGAAHILAQSATPPSMTPLPPLCPLQAFKRMPIMLTRMRTNRAAK
eukprot:574475-Prorocentrum_minimum.AAC.3